MFILFTFAKKIIRTLYEHYDFSSNKCLVIPKM